MCPSEHPGFVLVPGDVQTVTLIPLQGIVVAAPNNSSILWQKFTVARSAYATSSCAINRKLALEAELKTRFPGAVAYVGLPLQGQTREPVHVEAVTSDGGRGEVDWILQPVSEIHQPVYLDVSSPTGTGVVEAKVVAQDGTTEFSHLPIVLWRIGTIEGYYPDKAGRICAPVGKYKVHLQDFTPYLTKYFELETPEIDVISGSFQSVVIRIPRRLVKVELVPRLPHEPLDTRLTISVDWTVEGETNSKLREGGFTRLNWAQGERNPLSFWVPTCKLVVQASAPGYTGNRMTHFVDATAGDAVVIPIDLTYDADESR
jgi:hypothetical protein